MKQARHEQIVTEVTRNNSMTVKALSRRLGVSEVTVRRDLQELSAKGYIRRAFGVAYAPSSVAAEPPTSSGTHASPQEQSTTDGFRPEFWLVRTPEPSTYRIYRRRENVDRADTTGWNYAGAGRNVALLRVNNYQAGYDLCDRLLSKLGAPSSGMALELLILTSDTQLFDARIEGFVQRLEQSVGTALKHRVISHCTTASVALDALTAHANTGLLYSADQTSSVALIEALEKSAVIASAAPTTVMFGVSDDRIERAFQGNGPFRPTLAAAMPPENVAMQLLERTRQLAGESDAGSEAEASHDASAPEDATFEDELDYVIIEDPTAPDETGSPPAASGKTPEPDSAQLSVENAGDRKGGLPPVGVAHVRADTSEQGWSVRVEEALVRRASSTRFQIQSFDRSQVEAGQLRDARLSVARRALERVEPHTVILMNDGEITTILADLLAETEIRATVITNSTRVFDKLAHSSSIQLISTGGELRRPYPALVGWLAEAAVNELRADNLFLEPATISPEFKLCCANIAEAPMLQAMMRTSRRITVLCDQFRFDAGSGTQIGPIEAVSTLITDAGTPASARLSIRERGVEVIT